MSVSLTNSSQESTLRHGDTWKGKKRTWRLIHFGVNFSQGRKCYPWPWDVRYDVLWQSERCAVAIATCLPLQVTLVKSGGGFFPLHRFESAHTAFLIIVRRFCLANNLLRESFVEVKFFFNVKYNMNILKGGSHGTVWLLTAPGKAGCCSLWQSLCILCCLLLCFPGPTLPEGQSNNSC